MGGIKNPAIKHYFLYSNHGSYPTGERIRHLHYLCTKSCSTTPSKRTRDVSKVTCQNCLRELEAQGIL